MRLEILQGDCGLCDLCAIACSTEKFGVQNPLMSAIKVNHRGKSVGHQRVDGGPGILPCWHCDEPPCLPACPYDSMTIGADNVVSLFLDDAPEGFNPCVSCMKCVKACKDMHGVSSIFISQKKDRHMTTKSGRQIMKYSLYKCDMCGGDPKCVKICPRDAIRIVD
ncbi:MAG: 4Fe-4S dicluster domain-containing protein [Candidatus Kariarchaeaceae archaeon]|jgi:Fe-S-cluster-containing dehydrogenase component